MLEKMGFLLLSVAATLYLLMILLVLAFAFPVGIIGLLAIGGLGLLLGQALLDRRSNAEDTHYSQTIEF